MIYVQRKELGEIWERKGLKFWVGRFEEIFDTKSMCFTLYIGKYIFLYMLYMICKHF